MVETLEFAGSIHILVVLLLSKHPNKWLNSSWCHQEKTTHCRIINHKIIQQTNNREPKFVAKITNILLTSKTICKNFVGLKTSSFFYQFDIDMFDFT